MEGSEPNEVCRKDTEKPTQQRCIRKRSTFEFNTPPKRNENSTRTRHGSTRKIIKKCANSFARFGAVLSSLRRATCTMQKSYDQNAFCSLLALLNGICVRLSSLFRSSFTCSDVLCIDLEDLRSNVDRYQARSSIQHQQRKRKGETKTKFFEMLLQINAFSFEK